MHACECVCVCVCDACSGKYWNVFKLKVNESWLGLGALGILFADYFSEGLVCIFLIVSLLGTTLIQVVQSRLFRLQK